MTKQERIIINFPIPKKLYVQKYLFYRPVDYGYVDIQTKKIMIVINNDNIRYRLYGDHGEEVGLYFRCDRYKEIGLELLNYFMFNKDVEEDWSKGEYEILTRKR